MTDEQLEPWSGTQRRLPILVGVIWIVVGVLVLFLAYPDFVEFFASNKNFYGPVMPMHPRTIAGVTPERVGGGEVGFHINFKDSSHMSFIFSWRPAGCRFNLQLPQFRNVHRMDSFDLWLLPSSLLNQEKTGFETTAQRETFQ